MYTLQTATKEFIAHCKFEKNLSPKTIKAYEIDLKQLLAFLLVKKHPLEIASITKIQLREYLEEISLLKPKSIKRKVATIKVMFNFLEFEDRIAVNPLRKMRIKIKESKELPKVLDIDEMKGIFKSAYELKSGITDKKAYSYLESLRNIVVVELLFTTGGRVSEIANLKMEQVDLASGAITIKGKGNKERLVQICNKETLKILRSYHYLERKVYFQ